MDKNILPQTLKNIIFGLIQKEGINPSDFEWGEERYRHVDNVTGAPYGTYISSILLHKSKYYFKFNCTGSHFHPEYSPDRRGVTQRQHDLSWQSTVYAFEDWLKVLKPEVEAPDLWADAARAKSALGFMDVEFEPAAVLEEKLSEREIAAIKEALNRIEFRLNEELQLSAEMRKYVAEQKRYAIEASSRLTRKDYKLMLTALLLDIGQKVAFEPAAREIAWGIIVAAFQGARSLLGY